MNDYGVELDMCGMTAEQADAALVLAQRDRALAKVGTLERRIGELTAAYDPAAVERLVLEGRTHADAAFEPGGPFEPYAQAIAWCRANLRAMADQLEAARDNIGKLEAELEDLRGRKIGNADTWAEAASEATGMYEYMRKLHEAMKATIRSLLGTEIPAEELRRAVAELVR